MSYKAFHMFHKHIVQHDNDIKDKEERAYYTPLLVGSLQELMKEKVISLQEKITKKPRKVVEEELDIVGNKEMYNFTYNMIIFIEALLEKPFHAKYCTLLFDELMRQLEAIEKKIKE